MSDVTRVMSRTNSGLDVKDRIWLKLRIPDAFTGTNLVTWLYRNVHGFSDRREARKYAAGLLKVGVIYLVFKFSFIIMFINAWSVRRIMFWNNLCTICTYIKG